MSGKSGSAVEPVLTCPSGRCRSGVLLVGIVGSDNRVAFVSPALAVTDEFVNQALRHCGTERRFRFAEPCATDACEHWQSHACGLIERLVTSDATSPDTLPQCAIRSSCRWFAQRGRHACSVCPDTLRHPVQVG